MTTRARRVILLDVDGVLLDNDRYDSEWERLAGEAFAPLLGGDPAVWAEAQSRAWTEVETSANRDLAALAAEARPHPRDFWRQANSDWIEAACARAGVEAPETSAERVEVAEHALRFYFRNTRSPFPGLFDAISSLSEEFELHMSSGNPVAVVECVLENLGLRDRIGLPFGSDLLGRYKQYGLEFYAAILGAIDVPAEQVIVVDDLDAPLRAARQIGMSTVKIARSAPRAREQEHDLVIETLCDLSAHIAELTGGGHRARGGE